MFALILISTHVRFRPACKSGSTAAVFLLCAAFISLSACASVRAQPPRGWQWQNPLPQGNTIYAIRFAEDKETGWAVGSDGTILHTDNGGFEWEEQKSLSTTTLYGLYVKDAEHAVAVGARGVVLTTDNGGAKWTLQKTGIKGHLYAVTFAPEDPRRGWAVGT